MVLWEATVCLSAAQMLWCAMPTCLTQPCPLRHHHHTLTHIKNTRTAMGDSPDDAESKLDPDLFMLPINNSECAGSALACVGRRR